MRRLHRSTLLGRTGAGMTLAPWWEMIAYNVTIRKGSVIHAVIPRTIQQALGRLGCHLQLSRHLGVGLVCECV
jgi:hypothetical protein